MLLVPIILLKYNFRFKRKKYLRAVVLPHHAEIVCTPVSSTVSQMIRYVCALARSQDQGGHIVAKTLGGYGHDDNVFPQDATVI